MVSLCLKILNCTCHGISFGCHGVAVPVTVEPSCHGYVPSRGHC
jgi:hypothetical protein